MEGIKGTLKEEESTLKKVFAKQCVHAKSIQLCLTWFDPMDYSPPGSPVHGIPGKNAGVDCHALLQGIFQTQGLKLHLLRLLHWQVGSLPLAPPGKPYLAHNQACVNHFANSISRHMWQET